MKHVPWFIAGGAVLALVMVLATGRRGHAVAHPAPRPDITADRVLPRAMLPDAPGVREAYAAARNAPKLLDGIFCHCQCARTFGHRSLLTCFESDHGARCDICTGEAVFATELAARRSTLSEIRRAIDERFGS